MNKTYQTNTAMTDNSTLTPDALLAAMDKEHTTQGKLTLFLGAAPGVGKTYAMLEAAHKAQQEGVNILVGLVETHGRAETEALLSGLTVLPRQQVQYRKKTFTELDVTAILASQPEVVMVDELAHSNVPKAMNAKRYQDVLQLLAAGIDVYTAMNIQHVESLQDRVQHITGVTVRESVPDTVLARADDIVVVDITPSALQQRLAEGKVYLPKIAKRAIRHFFSATNLSALREFTLRTAAKYVGQDIHTHKQLHGIIEPWAVNQRIMVCLGQNQSAEKRIRYAQQLAEKNAAQSIAIYVESTHAKTLTE